MTVCLCFRNLLLCFSLAQLWRPFPTATFHLRGQSGSGIRFKLVKHEKVWGNKWTQTDLTGSLLQENNSGLSGDVGAGDEQLLSSVRGAAGRGEALHLRKLLTRALSWNTRIYVLNFICGFSVMRSIPATGKGNSELWLWSVCHCWAWLNTSNFL